ncbi:MAG: NADH:flavin oxidoreductase/NADH oxidase, partial [Hyphomicrobiaceae bacterium]
LAIFTDEQAESFRPLTTFLRKHGAVSAIQLGHAGRKACMQTAMEGFGPLTPQQIADGRRVWQPIAPSPIAVDPDWPMPHELTLREVQDVVEAFAAGARRAVKAGFDVVEVHGAHGYLITSFLSPVTNKRTDKYGGSREGRMRMALETVEACRAAIPDETPLFFRASCVDGTAEGWQLDDTVVLARELKALGTDVVDCSSGGLISSGTAARVTRSLGFQVPFSERVRHEADVATMAVGIILEAQQAEAILSDGKADLVAIGRQAQFNPNLALHWAHELGLNRTFELWEPEYGWWLEKRIRTLEGFATPTGVVTKRD